MRNLSSWMMRSTGKVLAFVVRERCKSGFEAWNGTSLRGLYLTLSQVAGMSAEIRCACIV